MSEKPDYSLLKAAALTSEELEARVLAEMRELNDSGAGMLLELHPAAAFAIVAFCQLALRHPAAAQFDSAANVTRFIEYVRAKFEPHAPAIALAIERGNDPQHDTPRQAEPSNLIEFLANRKEPASPEEVLEYLHKQNAAPPPVLTCPYCGHSQPAPFAKIDIYICPNCGRTVETA